MSADNRITSDVRARSAMGRTTKAQRVRRLERIHARDASEQIADAMSASEGT